MVVGGGRRRCGEVVHDGLRRRRKKEMWRGSVQLSPS